MVSKSKSLNKGKSFPKRLRASNYTLIGGKSFFDALEAVKRTEVKFGDKTLYMNIDDWKALRDFRKEKERR